MNNLRKLFTVSRPISWVNTAFPFGAGYLLLGGEVDLVFIIGSLFFLIPYNLLMYGVNDVFDYESDLRNPRKGGLEGAVEEKQFHPVILIACAVATVPFIIALGVLLSTPTFITLLAVLFFVVAYSIKGLRFKEVPILDSITSSLHFVGPLVVAMALFDFPLQVIPYAVAFFLWGMASHMFGAVQDIIPDRKGGLQSIATVFGARGTTILSLALYTLASGIVFLQGGLSMVVGIVGLAYVVNVAPYLRVTDKTSAITNKGWKRFLWINYAVGAIITLVLLVSYLYI